MGLMTGRGPFGAQPAGVFNFAAPPAGRAMYLEPSPKRIRVVHRGTTVADSRRASLRHASGHQPIYCFPREDVRLDGLADALWWVADDGLVSFYWNRIDHWYEEDEEVFGHPRDPYHRIDVLTTSRSLQFSLGNGLLAATERALALYESNLPTRWYLPRADVRAELQRSDTVTICPYKGRASHYSVRLGDGTLAEDLVWFYPDPFAEASRVTGLVCFHNERVDVEADGVALARPDSPWSGPRALNRPPAETRG